MLIYFVILDKNIDIKIHIKINRNAFKAKNAKNNNNPLAIEA